MDRILRAEQECEKWCGERREPSPEQDPEFRQIQERFVYGEIAERGVLDDRLRGLITLAVLTTTGESRRLREFLPAMLRVGIDPVAIKEAVYQCAPYVGIPKVQDALEEINRALQENGVHLPLAPQGTVTEETRLEQGIKVQTAIFGEIIQSNRENAPAHQKLIQDDLSAFCFGDFYTRKGLDLKTRELITFCIVSALGGCDPQVRAHVQGNYNMGNGKEILVAALNHCLPNIGFPRLLNALACVNAVLPEDGETETGNAAQ